MGGEDAMTDNMFLFEPLWEPDEDFYDEIGEVIMCPHCKNLADTEELIDGCLSEWNHRCGRGKWKWKRYDQQVIVRSVGSVS